MDRIANQLIKDTFGDGLARSECIVSIKSETIKNMRTENSEFSEAVNFSNLEIKKMISIFNTNSKLKNDYFKFGLFKMLSKEIFTELLKNIKCPFNHFDNVLETIVETQNLVINFFILRKH